MASRKKQDEKNLKTLREVGSLAQNKYCFECNQRGPTYVDVTVGSFVCTKCSGMLRGLTPPHRVKSISMATFTTEEVDLLRGRGNEYCRKVWLGLYEGTPPTHSSDEQTIRNFMIDKYERKRYYLDPGVIKQETKPLTQELKTSKFNGNVSVPRETKNVHNMNGVVSRTRPEAKITNNGSFLADFDRADIFVSAENNNKPQDGGFANFANFDSVTANGKGMPAPAELNKLSQMNASQFPMAQQQRMTAIEDKYAALKDLDNEMKSQGNLDWSSTGSNGSLYSSPTPTGAGSVYSSPSPQGSVFGSPSQGQCLNAFGPPQDGGTVSNPFGSNGNGAPWANGAGQPVFNPFRDQPKQNGFAAAFHPAFPGGPVAAGGANGLAAAWSANPFKVSSNPNNPFL